MTDTRTPPTEALTELAERWEAEANERFGRDVRGPIVTTMARMYRDCAAELRAAIAKSTEVNVDA